MAVNADVSMRFYRDLSHWGYFSLSKNFLFVHDFLILLANIQWKELRVELTAIMQHL